MRSKPAFFIDLVGKLNAPVLGNYGGKDAGIQLDDVHAMQAALQGGSVAARASRIEVYPEAPNAFHADYRLSYREAEARAGWQALEKWLAQHGVAP